MLQLILSIALLMQGPPAGDYFLKGKWLAAAEAYEAMASPGREDLLALADAYFYAGRPDLAEKTYLRLRDDPDARISLAMLKAVKKKRHTKKLKALFKHWPDNPRLWRATGIAHMRNGDDPAAVDYFKGAVERDPGDYMSYFYLGSIYEAHFAFDDAIATYKKAVEINPLYAQAVNNLGYSLKERHYYSYAIEQYQRAVELDPENAGYHYNLGVAYTQKKMIPEASEHHRKAIELDPAFAKAHYNVGKAYIKLGKEKDWPEIVRYYKEGLKHLELYIKYWNPSISPHDVPLPDVVAKEIEDLKALIDAEDELGRRGHEAK